jgi:uncharacterized repeat protein (TIGR03803 family)
VKGSGVITTIASFTRATGFEPLGGLVADANGNLFGTVQVGGANGYGSVFELPRGSSTITVLASSNAALGYLESGLAIDASGDLFGITYYSEYEVAAGSGTIKALVTISQNRAWGCIGTGICADGFSHRAANGGLVDVGIHAGVEPGERFGSRKIG